MATVTVKKSFSFLTAQDWDWNVTSRSATSITISDGVHTQVFNGSFSYAGGSVSGTVTSTEYKVSGASIYTVTGMTDSAAQLATYAETSGDTQATYAYVLRGNDKIFGSPGMDTLLGYGGNDTLNGGMSNDRLYGRSGNDVLNGGGGADTMIGGDGSDTYYVNDLDSVIETNASAATGGVDTVYSFLYSYTLTANVENGRIMYAGTGATNKLTGNGLNNTLSGGASHDRLAGLAGNDILNGGKGNDILIGGVGRDALTGGADKDTFDFNALNELGLGASRDIIKDFIRGQDKIDLSTIDAKIAQTGDQAFTFVNNFTASVGQVRYNSGIVYLNTDTDTAAEYEIQLTGSVPSSLSATDFVL